jgi:alpha-beta hydrolase superfamily lysophospholipase
MKPWISIPEYKYSKAKKADVSKTVTAAMEELKESGFDDKLQNWYLVGHSVGGTLTQDFLNTKSKKFDA